MVICHSNLEIQKWKLSSRKKCLFEQIWNKITLRSILILILIRWSIWANISKANPILIRSCCSPVGNDRIRIRVCHQDKNLLGEARNKRKLVVLSTNKANMHKTQQFQNYIKSYSFNPGSSWVSLRSYFYFPYICTQLTHFTMLMRCNRKED